MDLMLAVVEDSAADRHGPLALRRQAGHADATHVRLGEFAVRGLVSRWQRTWSLAPHPERSLWGQLYREADHRIGHQTNCSGRIDGSIPTDWSLDGRFILFYTNNNRDQGIINQRNRYDLVGILPGGPASETLGADTVPRDTRRALARRPLARLRVRRIRGL